MTTCNDPKLFPQRSPVLSFMRIIPDIHSAVLKVVCPSESHILMIHGERLFDANFSLASHFVDRLVFKMVNEQQVQRIDVIPSL
jgi:hypothetical protein